ncbi:MAG: site-specific integrase [Desulfovibrio sp.]|uniref:tyrosine-type recombinase/integrase n=1 Tax=Desulfovibrio sp. TaxID=885 RepID=UPI00135D28C0|nr:site-specific integrase [Desulfovibrio sp.]MTJ94339.1 site-specific integrase [Desulfovibrio sp.]
MTTKWKTADRGIRYREHNVRKRGIRPDRYYTIRLIVHGKRIEEALGWSSEGWTLEKVRDQLHELRQASKIGSGPFTLREKRIVAAENAKEEARKAAENPPPVDTIAAYFREHYEPWATATKPKGFPREKSIWRVWLEPLVGDKPIKNFVMQDWDDLVKKLNEAPLSQRSREYITGTLRRIFKHALNRRVVAEGPPAPRVIGCTAPKDNRRQRVITDAELQLLLEKLKARDIRAWRVTLFAASTGCRAGEAFNLTWAHLDLANAKATFPKTKNGRSRTVPLGNQAITMLAALPVGRPQDFVFVNRRSVQYTTAPAAFRCLINEMNLNDGREPLDRFSFHSLRHMAATRLAKTLPLRGLMDILGWEAATMALRYSHTSDADRKLAAETLDTAFHIRGQKKDVSRSRKRA